ncbi:Cytochrome c [Novipirellula galeiformis]|uniref:Cytochrome c n=2 Tax=Novipirellula galeiformis TaxID=2528004 RepID=A0A5C6C470_9BACT|nr:Cytochrome c [Novipirellula galeiformis]
MMMIRFAFLVFFACFCAPALTLHAELLRRAEPLEQQLKNVDSGFLASEVQQRGDARRGAIVFFKSAAGCVNCHSSGDQMSPLGPNLAELGTELTDQYLVESLLFPSRHIRKGFETFTVLTVDGQVHVGLIASEDDDKITMRLASDLTNDFVLPQDEIEGIKKNDKSMMPDGLIASLKEQREFLDLARYVIEVARGGKTRAAQLRPSPEELKVKDDSVDLNHAGIIGRFGSRDFEAGKAIYHGYCFDCHGSDGNTPALSTARAFGTEKLKFGANPYEMFMTLTKGNGLMAPMSHLTPKERYQVVHYIREAFMKGNNPDYVKVTPTFLQSLPKGEKNGTEIENVERDFGPALASQLRRDFRSVLNVKLGEITIAYNLHSMDQADLWSGFLDLSETQHVRPRGEGTADPDGESISELAGWRWGHGGTLDYSREGFLPRGPIPAKWMDYRGHYLHHDRVTLSYTIDGREILESPTIAASDVIAHEFQIGAGEELILCVAQNADEASAVVAGDADGTTLTTDSENRLVLRIPADTQSRVLQLFRTAGRDQAKLKTIAGSFKATADLVSLTKGGPTLWPEEPKTVGYRGLEQGGYALDTLTIPGSTPWNTWFRTTSLDFLSDGRMVLATHGGDVWIVSGIDDDLLELKWKRFAGGLYEPFGVKVVDDQIYLTCKDRLTRLHDQDGNGEADFYESFCADIDVSTNFHAFNFDLQTDDDGNFYYSKSGHGADFSLPGAVFKISPDGKHREVLSTGFRTPNGLGSMPGGRITASDNQGQWVPASKVILLKKGGFYGWVPTYSIPGKWAPDGGNIDIKKVVAPESVDPPLVFIPQEVDNSSGGQIWVDDKRFGPLSNHLLHTSFGRGWMSYLMIQDFDDVSQAALVNLPFDFSTGIMRGRVNPVDGQVYATGLQGWNGGGRIGLEEKGIQRLRYTGRHYPMITDASVQADGLTLKFNFELDPKVATDVNAYDVKQWNYLWSKNYGSKQYSVKTGEVGVDDVPIESVVLDDSGTSVKLKIANLQPADQVHVILHVRGRDGEAFKEEIYWTINRVPDAKK